MHLTSSRIISTLLCLSLTCAAAAVLPSTDPSLSPQLHTSLSALPDRPDERWRGLSAYRKPEIANITIFMACILAMQELAALDPNQMMIDEREWTHPKFPGVVVSVEGYVLTTVRWAMWLIAYAVRDILSRDRYEQSLFIGYWQNVRVATVNIISPGSSSRAGAQAATKEQLRPGNTELAQQEGGGIAMANAAEAATKAASLARNSKASFIFVSSHNDNNGSSSNSNTPTLTDDEIHATVTYLSKPISRGDIFMAIIWLILSFTPHYHEPLNVFQCNLPAITAEIKTTWSRERGLTPIDAIIGGDVINMLARLPEELLRKGKWCEMNIFMLEGTVMLGKGVVRAGPMPKPKPKPNAVLSG